MTRAEAKTIALKIVVAWYWKNCPISGSLNGYSLRGTLTGRWRGTFDPAIADYHVGDFVMGPDGEMMAITATGPNIQELERVQPNRNGNIFPILEINQADIERRMFQLMHHREPEPDVLTDRETAAAIQRRLFDYARADAEISALMAVSMEHGVPIITSVQQTPLANPGVGHVQTHG